MRFDQGISNSQNRLLLNYDGSTDEFTEELLGVSFLDLLKCFRLSLSSGRSALIYQFTDTSVAASAVGGVFREGHGRGEVRRRRSLRGARLQWVQARVQQVPDVLGAPAQQEPAVLDLRKEDHH